MESGPGLDRLRRIERADKGQIFDIRLMGLVFAGLHSFFVSIPYNDAYLSNGWGVRT